MPIPRSNRDDIRKFCEDGLKHLLDYYSAVSAGTREGAADAVNKSGEAIGQSIRALGKNLSPHLNGGTLLRTDVKRSVKTTDAGELAFEFSKKILAESRVFLETLHRLQHDTEVKVATIHSAWVAYGSQLALAFSKELPGGVITPKYIGGRGDYPLLITQEVLERTADVGITNCPPPIEPPLTSRRLIDSDMLLVFSAKYAKPLPAGDTVNLERIVRQNSAVRIAIHKDDLDNPLGDRVRHYLERSDGYLGVQQLYEVQSVAEIMATIHTFPDVISILPTYIVLKGVRENALRAFYLDPPFKGLPWSVIYRKATTKVPVLKFLDCLGPLYKTSAHKKLSLY